MEKVILEFTKKELEIILIALQDNTIRERHDLGLKIQNGECTK